MQVLYHLTLSCSPTLLLFIKELVDLIYNYDNLKINNRSRNEYYYVLILSSAH